jgi:hypothetical protein
MSILIPIACMVIGVVVGALFVGGRRRNSAPADNSDQTPVTKLARVVILLGTLKEGLARLWFVSSRLLKRIRIYWLKIDDRLQQSSTAGVELPTIAQGRDKLRKCLERVNQRTEPEEPENLPKEIDPGILNARARIGRQPKGDSWQSVLIVDLCGTIEAPDEEHEVGLEVTLADVTDDKANPLSALTRPKNGSIHTVAPFVYQTGMGKLCHQTTVLEDWTSVAQISPEWFVLPRQGHRQLQYSIAVVSQATGDHLANTTCTAPYESIETGYLDIEDNIQRAKTLAVGLAFSVGAANNALLEPEINVIYGWVKSNFGSADASESAQLELERALGKTAAFFHRGGHLNLPEICGEIVEIAPMVGRLDILDLCLRVAAAKGQVTKAELPLLKDLAEWLKIDRSRLRAMVEKILPISMHKTQDAEIILGVTTEMTTDEARHQLNREYAKWSSRVISSDPCIRKQADQMLNLIANARTQYVGVKLSHE